MANCEVSLVTELMLRSRTPILSHLALFRSGEWVYKPNYLGNVRLWRPDKDFPGPPDRPRKFGTAPDRLMVGVNSGNQD